MGHAQDIVLDVLAPAEEDLRLERALAQAVLDGVHPAPLDAPGAVVFLPASLGNLKTLLADLELAAPAQVVAQVLEERVAVGDPLLLVDPPVGHDDLDAVARRAAAQAEVAVVLVLAGEGADDAGREATLRAGGDGRELPFLALRHRLLEVEPDVVVLADEALEAADDVRVDEQIVGAVLKLGRLALPGGIGVVDLHAREGNLVEAPGQVELVEDDHVLAVLVR